MKIERIYIACCRRDIRWTQCCVASIRCWYPDMPISLIKDDSGGAFDTSDLERFWQVDVMHAGTRYFSWGLGKIEPMVLPQRQRCLILDSDIVFLGRVLDPLEDCDEDFVINGFDGKEDVERYFFSTEGLHKLDPSFDLTLADFIFNTGQMAVTSGVLGRSDFSPFLNGDVPQQLRRPDVFFNADQGIVNYLVLKGVQEGRISLRRVNFMWWANDQPEGVVRIQDLGPDSPYKHLLHWAGPKSAVFSAMKHADVLRHFEAAYYARLPQGRWRRSRALAADLSAAAHRWVVAPRLVPLRLRQFARLVRQRLGNTSMRPGDEP